MTASAFPQTRDSHDIIFIAGGHGSQSIQPPDDDHDLALIHRIKADDFDARQQLIASNLRHVLHSNRRYSRNGTRIFDLLRAGNLGLLYALENFVPESEDGFPAYADMCIRQHIERVLNAQCPSAAHKGNSSASRPCQRTHVQAKWLHPGHNQTTRQMGKFY